MSLYMLLLWAVWCLPFVRSQTPYPITGVKVANPANGVPMRKNINDLQKAGGPQWELYLRSLDAMYKDAPTNQLSYFQISGIHGQPYIEWNGAGGGVNGDWRGYCPHGENIFLPWHRPYVLLFEQRLVATATRLAQLYPQASRARYVSAAQTLRAPYWDWAETSAVPPATVPKTFKVNVPNGNNLRIIDLQNPLATYRLPQGALSGNFGIFDEDFHRQQIERCVSPQRWPGDANEALASLNLRKWTYDTMTIPRTFDDFGSTRGRMSIESIHNDIHSSATCGNQFTDARLSAFDPLFMLHHCQVDRLWTYWQFMKPSETTFKQSYEGSARFATRDGAIITPDSPLRPFYATSQQRHTVKSVNSIRKFGYTYEGLEYWKKTAAQLTADATALINRKYGPAQLKLLAVEAQPQVHYFVRAQLELEELERPCSLNFYINSTKVGTLSLLAQPPRGPFNGKFALGGTTATPDNKNETLTEVLESIRVEINKGDGSDIPVATAPSLKIFIEDAELVPPDLITEIPKYENNTLTPAPKE